MRLNPSGNVHLWMFTANGSAYLVSLCGIERHRDRVTKWYERKHRRCTDCVAMLSVLALNNVEIEVTS